MLSRASTVTVCAGRLTTGRHEQRTIMESNRDLLRLVQRLDGRSITRRELAKRGAAIGLGSTALAGGLLTMGGRHGAQAHANVHPQGLHETSQGLLVHGWTSFVRHGGVSVLGPPGGNAAAGGFHGASVEPGRGAGKTG